MMKAGFALVVAAVISLPAACGGGLVALDDGGVDSGGGGSLGPDAGTVLHSVTVDKVDLLFMIDNGSEMAEMQRLLAQAIPDLIQRLTSPNCIQDGTVVGSANADGVCATGTAEFTPVHDMHLGIVTSSLGGRGASTTCDPSQPNSGNLALPSHNDDRGELINRGGDNETPVPNAGQPLNFLAWYPTTPANAGGAAPPVPPETSVGDPTTPGTLVGDFSSMLNGVHFHGCGFGARDEAWYRFLVQPDPFDSIQIDGAMHATLQGVDSVILNQRRAFLRPDSVLAGIVVADENEEAANPLSVGGEGWLLEEAPWPASPTMGGAPEGTIECKANPLDPKCSSCGFLNVINGLNYATRCPADPPSTALGYLDPSDDNINLRFFHQKQRFGISAEYPASRYIRGLTAASVPDRNHEVDGNGNYIGDQDQHANCVNPIFAQNLPTDPTKDLCNLTRGPRTPDLVYYATIAGVPHQLLQAHPGDPECPAGTNQIDCAQKRELTPSDWLAITGKDPEHLDFTGADFHMLESEDARPQSACPPSANDHCDAINGREWNTQKGDIQFACTFPLAQPRDCNQPQWLGACKCAADTPSQSAPLCQWNGVAYTTQIGDGATPSITEMVIAHAMANQPSGNQGIVSSACPIHTTETTAGDPLFGYRPAINAIVDRLGGALRPQ